MADLISSSSCFVIKLRADQLVLETSLSDRSVSEDGLPGIEIRTDRSSDLRTEPNTQIDKNINIE
jgi:hypothetical protein